MAVLALLAQAAFAQERPLSLRVDNTVAWETNLFRLPDAAADPQLARGIAGKADRLSTMFVTVQFDKTYSQQRWIFDASKTATRYDKFSFLDRETDAYRGEWQWHLSPRISGTLGFDRNESPLPFDQTRDLEANSLISTNRVFTAAVSLSGGWQLLGGVRQGDRTYARPFAAAPNSSYDGFEGGVRYTMPSQSSITLMRRSQRGTSSSAAVGSPVALATGKFVVDETEALVAWPLSGRSELNGRLTMIERRHAEAPERDFSGFGGTLSYRWLPTGKLSLNFSAQRNLTPFIQDTRSSYFVQDTLAIAPSWQLSEKTRLGLSASHQATGYLGAIGAQTSVARRDILRSLAATADWSPFRMVSFNASLRREYRTSTDAQFDFNATVANIGASLRF